MNAGEQNAILKKLYSSAIYFIKVHKTKWEQHGLVSSTYFSYQRILYFWNGLELNTLHFPIIKEAYVRSSSKEKWTIINEIFSGILRDHMGSGSSSFINNPSLTNSSSEISRVFPQLASYKQLKNTDSDKPKPITRIHLSLNYYKSESQD